MSASFVLNQIADVIERSNLSLRDVERRVGSRVTLRAWLDGKHSPNIYAVENIADVLGARLVLVGKGEFIGPLPPVPQSLEDRLRARGIRLTIEP